jgi:hypothetical protein
MMDVVFHLGDLDDDDFGSSAPKGLWISWE